MAEEALQQTQETEEVEIDLEDSQEIEVEGEEVEQEEPKQETKKQESSDEEIEDYSDGVKKRINKLTYKIREAERRESAALEYAKGLQEELNKTKNTLSKTDKNLYDEYSARVETQLKAAEADYKKAYESGDTDAMLQAQKEVAKYAVEQESLTRVQSRQTDENEKEQVEDTTVQNIRQPQPLPEPELTPQPDPKAQEWASRNEWFGDDIAMTTSAFAFHRQLVEQEGYDPTSDDYYSEIDKRLKEAFPHKLGNTSQGNVNEVVTGSSRGANTTRARSRRKVKLTPSQVAIAKRLGVPLEEYAKHIK
jgi:hypothetical protein